MTYLKSWFIDSVVTQSLFRALSLTHSLSPSLPISVSLSNYLSPTHSISLIQFYHSPTIYLSPTKVRALKTQLRDALDALDALKVSTSKHVQDIL